MSASGTPRKGLLGYFVHHRTAANLLLLLMLLGGLVGGLNLRAQFFPDIVRESITVSVTWEGAGAADVDEGVVAALEPPLLAVPGVEEAIATSREGAATIAMVFEDGWDMSRASDEVQAAVDGVTTLPDEIEEPTVRRDAYTDRVVDVALTGWVGIDRLAEYSDELVARLFQAGVPRTTVKGIPDEVIRVVVPEEAQLRHNITLREVADAVGAEVTGTPSGSVDATATRVRAGLDKRSAEDIGETVLRSQADGSKLTLRDVATIENADFEDSQEVFRDGVPTLIVSVLRDASGNAIKIQKITDQVVAEMAPTLPDGVEIITARSRAEPITDRLEMLTRNGLTGLVLVLGLLFLFLSARTAFWVAAGIPISIAATVAMMYLSGQTLNMISMFGIIISLGIIVDDAIVVAENADQRARNGAAPADASEQAARRMAAPVLSASITTVIAFSALVLIGGRFGALIAAIPFVVSAVIIASLIESFLILPNHIKHALSAKKAQPWYDAPSRGFNRGFRWVREHLFRPFMRWVVKLRYLTLSFAIAALLYSLTLFVGGDVKWEFFSRPERGTISANVIMDSTAKRADTKAMLDEMNRALKVVNERYKEKYHGGDGRTPLDFSQATLGGTVGWRFSAGDNKDKDLLGGFQAALIDADLRPYSVLPVPCGLGRRGERLATGRTPVPAQRAFRPRRRCHRRQVHRRGCEDAEGGIRGPENRPCRPARRQRPRRHAGLRQRPRLIVTLTPRGEALGFTTRALGGGIARAAERHRGGGIRPQRAAGDGRNRPAEAEIGANYLEAAHIRAPNGSIVTHRRNRRRHRAAGLCLDPPRGRAARGECDRRSLR